MAGGHFGGRGGGRPMGPPPHQGPNMGPMPPQNVNGFGPRNQGPGPGNIRNQGPSNGSVELKLIFNRDEMGYLFGFDGVLVSQLGQQVVQLNSKIMINISSMAELLMFIRRSRVRICQPKKALRPYQSDTLILLCNLVPLKNVSILYLLKVKPKSPADTVLLITYGF